MGWFRNRSLWISSSILWWIFTMRRISLWWLLAIARLLRTIIISWWIHSSWARSITLIFISPIAMRSMRISVRSKSLMWWIWSLLWRIRSRIRSLLTWIWSLLWRISLWWIRSLWSWVWTLWRIAWSPSLSPPIISTFLGLSNFGLWISLGGAGFANSFGFAGSFAGFPWGIGGWGPHPGWPYPCGPHWPGP